MKKLNCSVSGKLNSSFSSAEITRRRRTENLNLKQKLNQSTPELLLVLTGFFMRYNHPASYWTSICESKVPKFCNLFWKMLPVFQNFDHVTVS